MTFRNVAAVFFWLTAAATLAVIGWLCLSPRVQVFDVRSAASQARLGDNLFEAKFHSPLPHGCVV